VRIGMIGAGRMGQALTGLFVQGGHEVVLANSRGPASLAELTAQFGERCSASDVPGAVQGSDLVVLATPWGRTAEAVSAVGDWSGVVVVDTTNNRSKPGPDGLIDIGDRISSEIVAELVPGARLVKAFNTTPIPFLVEGLGSPGAEANAVYVAGDDATARALVGELIASIGGKAVHTGDLHTGGWLQGMSGPLAGSLQMITPAEALARLEQARGQLAGTDLT
jgi:8-hydroxy-5-deazaflavin:NADPH oxidoreductase